MPNIREVRAALPPFLNERIKIKQEQGTTDIENEIISTHQDCAPDYDLIYELFDRGETEETARGIFDFLKGNLIYQAETENQTVASPAAIFRPGARNDCKHFSLAAGGIIDSIKRNEGDRFTWAYRFVSETNDPRPTHVFVVIRDAGREYWIDPVLTFFDQRKSYKHKKDVQPMALYRINGTQADIPINDINPEVAANSFLTMINANMFSLKELFNRHPEIVNTEVKAFYMANGLDFNQLLNFLQ